jgi:hypothetical protein
VIHARMTPAHLLAAMVLITSACDASHAPVSGHRPAVRARSDEPSNVVVWGCGHAMPSQGGRLDPRWRETSTVVGNFGFYGIVNFMDYAWRPRKDADLQFKLPVIIEGHAEATVWVPAHLRDRVAIILSDVPRRGPGNTYRVDDGHQRVRFEPCADQPWSAWVAGLALADRRESALEVRVENAPRPTEVTLGPWTCRPTAVSTANCVIIDSRHPG